MNLPLNASKPLPELTSALRSVLKPLVRFLIKNAITFPFLAELLKEVYVEVAEKDFKIGSKEQTDSRINFLTGIHRKDTKRLRHQSFEDNVSKVVSLGAQIVAQWISHDDFIDQYKSPIRLPRLKKEGGDKSFESLVMSINKDIKSRAILDEWLRLGVVHLDQRGYVCLNTSSFIPQDGFEEKLWFFGENLRDHISAATHNVAGEKPAFLERAVFYDELTPESVEILSITAKKASVRLINKLNKMAIDLQEADKTASNNMMRMRFGAYFYQESDDGAGKTK